MRLADLEPTFLSITTPTSYQMHDDIAKADGLMFLCPKCFQQNGGNVGTHAVICWTPKVPQDVEPKPGRWEILGTGYGDLELRAGSSSVLLTSGCMAHFFVRNGEIVMA